MARLKRWIHRTWILQPRIALTLRAALAAGLAWTIVSLLPLAAAAQYPYYAPFGAVIATTFTVSSSVRESVQAVAAIALGGLTAGLVDMVFGTTTLLTIVLVVAAGVALAGLRPLGSMGGWVPTAGIFTLIIGHGETAFAGSYAGLTLLGACVGVGVNALFPPLPVGPASRSIRATREAVAGQLRDLAEALETTTFPSMADWEHQHRGMDRARLTMREAIAQAQEARRANRRARRHSDDIDALVVEADALERLTFVVADLSDLILRDHLAPGPEGRPTRLPADLRAPIVHSIRLLAGALSLGDVSALREELAAVDDQLATLVSTASERSGGPDDLVLNSVLLALRRGLDTFAAQVPSS
ncbi:hypothetical protein EXU48_15470 [Occultella glacieicola]|uniref:FUSC family protein n=1 Tax=Occultella glacieicola TaxID=2518684 RepID=A0ABY2E172_9MICO|nr:hypothetical protein [Occultella glacieicola]TDE91544.1 hypothetical protein EXU48_15470 [Occultella glacieicola]